MQTAWLRVDVFSRQRCNSGSCVAAATCGFQRLQILSSERLDVNRWVPGTQLAIHGRESRTGSLGECGEVIVGPELVAGLVSRRDCAPHCFKLSRLLSPTDTLIGSELVNHPPRFGARDDVQPHDTGVRQEAKHAHLRDPAHSEVVLLLVEPACGHAVMDMPTPRRG